jgi:hypothetical protein
MFDVLYRRQTGHWGGSSGPPEHEAYSGGGSFYRSPEARRFRGGPAKSRV